MGTVVVFILLACGLTAALRVMIKNKKSGKMISCGGDCSHCGGGCAYHRKQK